MAAIVSHGRRKGQNRSTPEITLEMQINGQTQSAPPGVRTQNLNEVCVLTKNDWNRIQTQLHRRQIEEENRRRALEEKREKHERSLAETKNWANTIAGQRQKKLEARNIREAKEEEERKLIDIEEAKFQAERRKEAIEKAKTLQYYQTDRVKGFHGALVLTEVLKERDAQVELNRLRKAASVGQDKEFLMRAQQELEEGIKHDQEQAMKHLKLNRDTAEFQIAQVQRHQQQLLKERDDDLIEGEELKKLKAQHAIEKQKLQEIKKREAKQLMEENLKQIEDVKRTELIRQRQQEEEDDEIRIFAAAKRKMMKLRAEKERQLHNEKQEHLERIRSKLHAQNLQKLDDEDDRIRRAVEEAEMKRERDERAKEEKTRRAFEEMAKHRHEMMRQNELNKQEERRKELEMLALKKEVDADFAKNEAEKRLRKYKEARDLGNHHMKQTDERYAKEQAARVQQLAQETHNMNLIALEEQQFQEYAKRVIDHCEKGGRNVYPLKKAARVFEGCPLPVGPDPKAASEGAGGGLGPLFVGKGGIRPSYMSCDQNGVQLPSYQRGTTEEVKEIINGKGNTDKRLGFVW